MNTVDVKNATYEMGAQRTTMHQGFKLIKKWKKGHGSQGYLGQVGIMCWSVKMQLAVVEALSLHMSGHVANKQQTRKRAAYTYPPFSLANLYTERAIEVRKRCW